MCLTEKIESSILRTRLLDNKLLQQTMGVAGLFSLFEPQEVRWKDLAGSTIAIDASYELYRTLLGGRNYQLKDSNGNPTNHINSLLQMTLKRRKHNITEIFVFDSNSNVLKAETLAARSTPSPISRGVKADTRQLFHYLGVSTVDSPPGIEAEHACCCLGADCVWTGDSDALLFGADRMLRKIKNKCYIYNREAFLEQNGLTQDELIKIGIILGTDFAPKTPKIGPKTVLNKFQDIELSERQQQAFELFKSECPALVRVDSDPDYTELSRWLIEEKSFSAARISKLLSPFQV